MKVRVHLFARLRDLAGAEWIEVELKEAATIADLRRVLAESSSALAPLLSRSAVAMNEDFAEDDQRIPENATLAVLPPVSGGS